MSYAAAQTFTDNGMDDRASTTDSAGITPETRHYIYAPDGRVLGEYGAGANEAYAEFIWMSPEVGDSGMFGGDDGLGGYMPLAVAADDSGGVSQRSWVHGNHMGVPAVYTDASGNEIAFPTGYNAPSFPGQNRTFADLYYNRYRDYDTVTGRYVQADPIGLAGGPSPYSYAMNNPLRWKDPDGKIPLPLIIGGIGAIFGGGNFIGQLYYNGGDIACVDISDVVVATGVGFVSGYVAPVAAPGIWGAIGLGGISNVAQLGISDALNGQRSSWGDVLWAAGTGAVGGLFGGGVGSPPRGAKSDPVWDTADAALNRALNESARVRGAVGLGSFIRNSGQAAIGNVE